MKWFVRDTREVYNMLLSLAEKTGLEREIGHQEVFYFKDEKKYGLWGNHLDLVYKQISVDEAIERITLILDKGEPNCWFTRTPVQSMRDLLSDLVPNICERNFEDVFYRHKCTSRKTENWGFFSSDISGYKEISFEKALQYLTKGKSVLECLESQ